MIGIEAYAVSTTLKLNDLVGPVLLKLSTQFRELEAQILGAGEKLKLLGAEATGIRELTTSTAALSKNLAASSVESAALARNLAAVRATGAPRVGVGGGGYGGGGGGGAGGHGGRLHVGPGGVGIGAASVGIGGAALPLIGVAAAGYGVHELYESAKDYETVFQRFKALNLGDQVNQEADKFARSAHVYGVSSIELMKVLSESVGLFGDFKEAKQFAPKIAVLARANEVIFQGKKGEELDEAGMMGLLKFIDRRGGFKDEASFQKNLDLAERMITGSGGRIKFSDLNAFSQRGGTAFRGLSDEGVLGMAGLLIEQGGSAAGVGFMSMYQNLVAGRTPKKTMALLQDMGLGKLEMQEHATVGGQSMKSLIMTNIKGTDLLQADPRRWYVEVFLPALAAKGITKESDIVKTTNDLLSNRTASNQGTIFTTQNLQLLRDYKLAQGASTSKQVVDLYQKTGAGAEADFSAAWTDFKTEFGKDVLPKITEMIKVGTTMLRGLTEFYDSHKDFFKGLENVGLGGAGKAISGAAGYVKDFVFGSSKAETSGVGDVFIDGDKVGKHVGNAVEKGAARPQTGGNAIDPNRLPARVGTSGKW